MLCFNFHMADAFRTSSLVVFLLLIQLSGYTSNARGNIGIPPLGTSSTTQGSSRKPYIPPRPVWCRYGYYIGCCYGWRRDPASGQCTPICRNGCVHGTCVAPNRCQCDTGFTGSRCDQDYNECSRRPCQHRCMNTYGSYRCYCEQGYMLSNNARNCYRDNRCSRAKCAYGCVQQQRSVRCICPKGWRVDENNRGCIDVDECAVHPGICPAGRRCWNTHGSYTCLCPSGQSYQWINERLQCADEDECAVRKHNCDPNATCYNKIQGFTCTCNTGYVGDGKTCIKVQEPPRNEAVNPPGLVADSRTCADKPCFMGVECRDQLINPNSIEYLSGDVKTIKMFKCGPCPEKHIGDGETCKKLPNPHKATKLPFSREQTTPTTKEQSTVPKTTTPALTTTTLTTIPTTTPTTQPPTTTPTTSPPTTTPTTMPTTTVTTTVPTTPTTPTTLPTTTMTTTVPTTTPTTMPTTTPTTTPPTTTPTTMPTTTPTTTPMTTTPTTMPTTTPTTTPMTTTPTTMPTTTPTTTPMTTTPTTMPTTTPTTTPMTTTPTTMPTTTPTTTPMTTTPTTMPTTTPTTTPMTTTPTTMPTTTPTTTPMTTTPTTIPTTTPTTTPPTTTPTTMPTTTPTTTQPTTTPTTMPTTTPTTTQPTTTPTTMPTTTPTTTPPTTTPTTMPTTTPTTTAPTTTIPTTTPTTIPPTTTIPTTTEPPTTTPPPPGVRIVTVDRGAQMALLPSVEVRILVPGSNITRIWEESHTGATGSTLVGLPEEEPVIITFNKGGYLKSSITYKFERVGRNVITMPMNRAPEYREFTWRSGLGEKFKLGINNRNPFTVVVPPGALDVPEGTDMSMEFKEVDVMNPQELREAPELIGAHFKKRGDEDYEFEGLETFAMAELSIKKYYDQEKFRLLLPLEMTIPLYNLPADVRPGDKLEAWSYDPHRGVWLFEGRGFVERGRANEKIFVFYARHLSWWAVVRRIDTTNCVTVTTCYDQKCRYPAPNVPVRLRGIDFLYTSTRATDDNGMTCFHYKHHGEVEITSQCSQKVRVSRGKGKSSVCPAHFNTELIITEARRRSNSCGTVRLQVPENFINQCRRPVNPNRGYIIGTDMELGAEIVYGCDPPFDLLGATTRVCLECGIWSERQPMCEYTYVEEVVTPGSPAAQSSNSTFGQAEIDFMNGAQAAVRAKTKKDKKKSKKKDKKKSKSKPAKKFVPYR